VESTDPGCGELELRGPNIFRGYYIGGELVPRPSSDWFATGDLVRAAPNGALMLVGRTRISSSEAATIYYPSEVEAALTSHPEEELKNATIASR
jgi:long-chain acyl-CoA synthetase